MPTLGSKEQTPWATGLRRRSALPRGKDLDEPCIFRFAGGMSRRCVAMALACLAAASVTRGAQEPVLVKPFEVTPEGMVERPAAGDVDHSDGASAPEISRSRTLERVHWVCESQLLRSELTLFANGTLRLRQAPGKDQRTGTAPEAVVHGWRTAQDGRPVMWLRELRPEVLDAYVRRLAEPSREETPSQSSTVSGDWLADCVLHLDLPGREAESYRFGARDVVAHDLERTLGVVRELENLFQDDARPPEGVRQLPYGYEASRGDVLLRHDGILFEVQGFTADGSGVELLGIEHPLTLYLRPEDLVEQFRALVPRWSRERQP